MKKIFLILLLSIVCKTHSQINLINLPIWNADKNQACSEDWLIKPIPVKADIFQTADAKNIILYNGLVKRVFRLSPNLACTDYINLSNGQQLLRAIKPEARITINGQKFDIGGLHGQKENAYLCTDWIDKYTASNNDFQLQTFTVTDIRPFINWKPKLWALNKKQPTGKQISFIYKLNNHLFDGISVTVNYELYNGLPLIIKWISVENKSKATVQVGSIINEIVGVVEEESNVDGTPAQLKKPHGIYIESNYAFNNGMRYSISDQTTHWSIDSSYTSQVNYNYQTPCLLELFADNVKNVDLKQGESFVSIRTHELLIDSYDRERTGLAIRKMYSTVAPWTTENPIFMHLVSKNDDEVKKAIDQCVATGYEMLIMSFGSHCNMEDTSSENISRWKKMSDYAHQKNILIGGYSLFSSRKISDTDDVIDPITGKPDKAARFGSAPCMGSVWGLTYIKKLKYFMKNTGFDLFENDGPYPGDVCASTKHPGHKNLDDSQWRQLELQKELYHWCNENSIYVNAPDWYFLDGTNKTAIGYREVNYSLPRENQKILNRQNIFDGTWEKTTSMGWGFVPLTEYQGGGSAAILEPLSEHLNDYEQLMMQYYGAGVQACYRGPQLYDTDITKQLVTKTIDWYKKYRDILNSDIIHLRRADGRDWDGILHVNPLLKNKALLMVYNPLKEKIIRTIKVPLYYTGLTTVAKVREKENTSQDFLLNREYEIELKISIEPESYSWFVIE